MNITPELLARYTAGQCTPAEIQAVEQWLDDPDAVADAITEIPCEIRQESGTRVWARLRARNARPFWLHYRYSLSGIAAVLVLVSGIVWYTETNRAEEAAQSTVRMEAAVRTIRTQKVKPGKSRCLTVRWSCSVTTVSFGTHPHSSIRCVVWYWSARRNFRSKRILNSHLS